MFESISWVGVAVAAIAAFVLGWLWFGPLFLKPWMRELGKTQEQLNRQGPAFALTVAMEFVAWTITATVLAIIIERFGPGVTTGLTVGLLCAAGFVATTLLAGVLFAHTSPTRYWIEAGNRLVSYALMGAIYGFFA